MNEDTRERVGYSNTRDFWQTKEIFKQLPRSARPGSPTSWKVEFRRSKFEKLDRRDRGVDSRWSKGTNISPRQGRGPEQRYTRKSQADEEMVLKRHTNSDEKPKILIENKSGDDTLNKEKIYTEEMQSTSPKSEDFEENGGITQKDEKENIIEESCTDFVKEDSRNCEDDSGDCHDRIDRPASIDLTGWPEYCTPVDNARRTSRSKVSLSKRVDFNPNIETIGHSEYRHPPVGTVRCCQFEKEGRYLRRRRDENLSNDDTETATRAISLAVPRKVKSVGFSVWKPGIDTNGDENIVMDQTDTEPSPNPTDGSEPLETKYSVWTPPSLLEPDGLRKTRESPAEEHYGTQSSVSDLVETRLNWTESTTNDEKVLIPEYRSCSSMDECFLDLASESDLSEYIDDLLDVCSGFLADNPSPRVDPRDLLDVCSGFPTDIPSPRVNHPEDTIAVANLRQKDVFGDTIPRASPTANGTIPDEQISLAFKDNKYDYPANDCDNLLQEKMASNLVFQTSFEDCDTGSPCDLRNLESDAVIAEATEHCPANGEYMRTFQEDRLTAQEEWRSKASKLLESSSSESNFLSSDSCEDLDDTTGMNKENPSDVDGMKLGEDRTSSPENMDVYEESGTIKEPKHQIVEKFVRFAATSTIFNDDDDGVSTDGDDNDPPSISAFGTSTNVSEDSPASTFQSGVVNRLLENDNVEQYTGSENNNGHCEGSWSLVDRSCDWSPTVDGNTDNESTSTSGHDNDDGDGEPSMSPPDKVEHMGNNRVTETDIPSPEIDSSDAMSDCFGNASIEVLQGSSCNVIDSSDSIPSNISDTSITHQKDSDLCAKEDLDWNHVVVDSEDTNRCSNGSDLTTRQTASIRSRQRALISSPEFKRKRSIFDSSEYHLAQSAVEPETVPTDLFDARDSNCFENTTLLCNERDYQEAPSKDSVGFPWKQPEQPHRPLEVVEQLEQPERLATFEESVLCKPCEDSCSDQCVGKSPEDAPLSEEATASFITGESSRVIFQLELFAALQEKFEMIKSLSAQGMHQPDCQSSRDSFSTNRSSSQEHIDRNFGKLMLNACNDFLEMTQKIQEEPTQATISLDEGSSKGVSCGTLNDETGLCGEAISRNAWTDSAGRNNHERSVCSAFLGELEKLFFGRRSSPSAKYGDSECLGALCSRCACTEDDLAEPRQRRTIGLTCVWIIFSYALVALYFGFAIYSLEVRR